jgi:hypothetical protein
MTKPTTVTPLIRWTTFRDPKHRKGALYRGLADALNDGSLVPVRYLIKQIPGKTKRRPWKVSVARRFVHLPIPWDETFPTASAAKKAVLEKVLQDRLAARLLGVHPIPPAGGTVTGRLSSHIPPPLNIPRV